MEAGDICLLAANRYKQEHHCDNCNHCNNSSNSSNPSHNYRMPRQRQAARRIASLDTAPINEDDQTELIELLRLENIATNRLFINIFTLVFVLPVPLFVHVKYCRRSPVDAFLSIAVQVCAVVNVRYLALVDFSVLPLSQYYARWIKSPVVFSVFMNLLASLVAWRRWSFVPEAANWLFFAPAVSSVASTLVTYWVVGLNNSINGLEHLKYKYKSA